MKRAIAGAALAETAVVISFTLILLFGILQIGIIGYLQVAGDAATFMAAHEYTLGVSQSTIRTSEASIVPAIVATSVAFTPSPPPYIDPTVFSEIYGTFNNAAREGGYTMVRPQNFQVYLNQNAAAGTTATYKGVLPFGNTPISAGAVEGFYLMTQNEMDQFGVDPNTDVSGNILNEQYASPFLPQSDAIVANMNTPPYYVPYIIMKICPWPWTDAGGTTPSFTQECPNSEPWFLGLGEYLSNYNYAPTSMAMGVNAGDVFQAMAAHQRVYANLIAAFPNNLSDAVLADIQTEFQNHSDASDSVCSQTTTDRTNGTALNASANGCGAYFASSLFPNGGTCNGVAAHPVPLVDYDPMWWWEFQSSRNGPLAWTLQKLWTGTGTLAVPSPPPDSGGAADGPQGPSCTGAQVANWGGATFALVYEWDQPNFPSSQVGAGYYPTYPLQGALVSGDPAY